MLTRICWLCCCLLLAGGAWAETTAAAATPTHRETVIGNERLRVAISTLRASIRRVELLDMRPIKLPPHARGGPHELPDGPLPVLRAFTAQGNHNWIYADKAGLTSEPWQVVEQGPDHAVFGFAGANGLEWRMAYRVPSGALRIEVQLSVHNRGAQPVPLAMHVFPLNGVHGDYPLSEYGYQAVFTHAPGADGSISNHGMPQPGSEMPLGEASALEFLGLKSRFFAAWWKPAATAPAPPSGGEATAEALDRVAMGGPAAAPPADWSARARGFIGDDGLPQALIHIVYQPVELAPGARWERAWTITAASMTSEHLALVPQRERIIKYTDGFYRFFKILANGMTWILDALAIVVQHYGVAVILLTILVKAALFRTTYKQQESLLKLQKLAPELKYLQEQYKNNKQMLAQKQMELFQKHGVNPLGGCLPVFIQLPIFIALYQAFSHSADLRGTSFLWVADLTLPDQVIGVPIEALGGWVLSLNPLPIIYIAVSAWMSFSQPLPANPDPQQEMMAKMMRWLPIVFGIIFYNMPSGLVLYFTVQAVISTLEIKYIRKRLGMP
ncbi:MAG: membrane protein insertase YidC [Planctomycetota bacterium]|nr:membrane protein insertase YidC [Planctomycetota bacterium]MCX8039269.1 membrane protein insertase YidC [Planctomycetota bacterium]MDW8372621.1 membrane protein insertase YidC [Planctomycetota bacterium]